jgi:general secretion pathway protein D
MSEQKHNLQTRETAIIAVLLGVAAFAIAGCAALDADPRAPEAPKTAAATQPTVKVTSDGKAVTIPPAPAPVAPPAVQPAPATPPAPVAVPAPAVAKPADEANLPWYKRLFGRGDDKKTDEAKTVAPAATAKTAPASSSPAPTPTVSQNVPVQPAAAPVPAPVQAATKSATANTGALGENQPASANQETARLFVGTGQFVKPTPVVPSGPPPGDISLNFVAQDIRAIIDFIMRDVLGESFTVHQSVAGTTTIVTAKPIPRSALIPTLETLLRQNNAAMVKEDNIWRIVPVNLAVRGNTTPQLLPPGVVLKQGYNTILVPLKFLGVKEAQRILAPFAIDPANIQIDELRNMLILTGTQRELKHLTDTVDMFDIDWMKGMSVGVFTLKSTDVKTIQPELNKIFEGGPLAGAVRLVPLERLNGFLMITTQPEYLNRVREWLEKLDSVAGTAGGQRLFVYSVQNGKAENLAQLLGDIFGARTSGTQAPQVAPGLRPAELRQSITPTALPGQSTAPAPVPVPQPVQQNIGGNQQAAGSIAGVSKDLRVIADKDNNALLILATPGEYEVIESALRRLDVMPRQVLIDVTIAEVALNDNLKYGVDWFLQNSGLPGRPGYSGVAGVNFNGGLTTAIKDGIYQPAGPDKLGAGLQILGYVNGGLRTVISAVDKGGNVKLISNPTLMTSDNKAAQLEVGASISVNTGSTTGGGGVTTASNQYVSTGTILNITPRINAGGMISLEIDAEVSSPGDIPANGGNPPINRRRIKNSVTVQSEESIVVAGLIQENRSRSNEGIPLLSRIPIVGGVFGTQAINTSRTELLISLTPRLISNIDQNRQVVDELRQRFQGVGPLIPIGKSQRDINEEKKAQSPSWFKSLRMERLFDKEPEPVAAK